MDFTRLRGYGIDVSHHQDPDALWRNLIGDTADFCIVRASYGTRADRAAGRHVAHARRALMRVGMYAFWRPKQETKDQAAAFVAVASSCRLGDGDIVPAVDVESNDVSGERAAPGWNEGAEAFCRQLEGIYGSPPILYMSRTTWLLLGRPDWPLYFPLWVPDYRPGPDVRSPGDMPPLIWQHRVSPWAGPSDISIGDFDKERPELDHNRRFGILPSIGQSITDSDREKVRALVAENLRRDVQEDDEPYHGMNRGEEEDV